MLALMDNVKDTVSLLRLYTLQFGSSFLLVSFTTAAAVAVPLTINVLQPSPGFPLFAPKLRNVWAYIFYQ